MSDIHNIKSSMKYSLENYLSNKKTFIKMDPLVAEIIASTGLKDPLTSTLRNHERLQYISVI